MANAGDLCTLNDLKAWITPDSPDSDDPVLERLITAASDFIHRYLSRYLPQSSYHEIRDGTGGRTMVLANFPIVAVTGLSIGGLDVQAGTQTTFGYLFSRTSVTLRGATFARGRQNVLIDYVAGYPEVPPEVAQACIELVTLRYKERGREGVAQESVVGIKTDTYRVIDLTPSIISGLQPFRQVAPVTSSAFPFTPASDPIL